MLHTYKHPAHLKETEGFIICNVNIRRFVLEEFTRLRSKLLASLCLIRRVV